MGTGAGRDSRTQAAGGPPWCRCLADGLELSLHVQPGARRTALAGEHGGRLKLAVRAPATDGRANQAVLALVAEVAGVPQRAVELVSGAGARDKRVRIAGDPAALLARLRAAAA
jgi:uncharacterized protein (TIGR00251 family)